MDFIKHHKQEVAKLLPAIVLQCTIKLRRDMKIATSPFRDLVRSRVPRVSSNSSRADLGDGCKTEEGVPWVRPRTGPVGQQGDDERKGHGEFLATTAAGTRPTLRYDFRMMSVCLTNCHFSSNVQRPDLPSAGMSRLKSER